jgi:prevent-host-death family protein
MTMRVITVSELRRNVDRTTKELQQDEVVVITRHGRPQAVLVSYEHYEQLLQQAGDRPVPRVDPEVIRNDPEMTALAVAIKATPPNPNNVHPATASLADLLREAPDEPDFDLESWTQQWNAIEAEMKAREWANDIAEGHVG